MVFFPSADTAVSGHGAIKVAYAQEATAYHKPDDIRHQFI
jgi:hypothetical protein